MSKRTLVIGLGSSGSRMVDLLLRELRGIDGSLESFQHVHAIKIDTAKVSPKYVDGEQVRVVQMHEHIPTNSNHDWESYLSQGKYKAGDWLTRQTLTRLNNLDFSTGAGNYRPVGQFGMVMAAKSISKELSQVFQKLGLVNAVTEDGLNVFVLGFSGGGTCSGGLVTLLEALQLEIAKAAVNPARVFVLLSVPHKNFTPRDNDHRNFVPNTVGLLQSLNDARTLRSYGSLASTYEAGVLPTGNRASVYNENLQRLAHLVFCVQPANADDSSTASQSISDAVLANVLADSSTILERLVNGRDIQTFEINSFSTKRATYPRQEISEGLMATAMDQAMILWTGTPEASANVVGITQRTLESNDDGKHFGDVAGMIRIALDAEVQKFRLRLQSDQIRVGRASDYRIFVDSVSEVHNDFSNDLDIKSHDTTESTRAVIIELLSRLRETLNKHPKVGYSNLLRQSIVDIEKGLNEPDPTVTMNSVSTSEIEEVATDLSMQLNPVYRQSSYTSVAQRYLSQLIDELGDRAVEHLLNSGDYSLRFRSQLKRSLVELRNRLDNGSNYDDLVNLKIQDASVTMIVSQLQSWSKSANDVYSSLVRQLPNVFYVVDENTLSTLKENTTAPDHLREQLLSELIGHLSDPRRLGLTEVQKVVEKLTTDDTGVWRIKADSIAPASIDTGLLTRLGSASEQGVPCQGTKDTDNLLFLYADQLPTQNNAQIPSSALSVIELSIKTWIPMDNLDAFTTSHSWAEARKSIRDTTSDYDKHRTVYPSNQLGREELVKPGWPLLYAMVAPYNPGVPTSPSAVTLQADGDKPCLFDIASPKRRFIVDLGPHNSILDLDSVYSKVLTEDLETYAGTTQLVCERWRNYPKDLKSTNWLSGQSIAIRDHIDRVLDTLESQGVTDIKVDKTQYSLRKDSANIRSLSGVLLGHF